MIMNNSCHALAAAEREDDAVVFLIEKPLQFTVNHSQCNCHLQVQAYMRGRMCIQTSAL